MRFLIPLAFFANMLQVTASQAAVAYCSRALNSESGLIDTNDFEVRISLASEIRVEVRPRFSETTEAVTVLEHVTTTVPETGAPAYTSIMAQHATPEVIALPFFISMNWRRAELIVVMVNPELGNPIIVDDFYCERLG
jgi:hypothetical protein